MQRTNNNQLGFGTVGLVVVVLVLVVLGAGGWLVYNNQKKTTQPNKSTTTTPTTTKITNTTEQTTNTTDSTANWVTVDSIGGAYSMKVPDGWKLMSFPGNLINGDYITYSPGTPALISTNSTSYAGDQRKFNVSFSEKTNGQSPAPQWQSPNLYGVETKTDFSIGNLRGTRFSIEYTQTVTGVTKGDKLYEYEFFLPGGKGLNVLYIQYAGDTDNLQTVEQAIKSIVIK